MATDLQLPEDCSDFLDAGVGSPVSERRQLGWIEQRRKDLGRNGLRSIRDGQRRENEGEAAEQGAEHGTMVDGMRRLTSTALIRGEGFPSGSGKCGI